MLLPLVSPCDAAVVLCEKGAGWSPGAVHEEIVLEGVGEDREYCAAVARRVLVYEKLSKPSGTEIGC